MANGAKVVSRGKKVVVQVKGAPQRQMRRRRPGKGRPRIPRALDAPAQQYAALLMDPCNSAIVPPIYPGSDSGFLFRAESFATFGASATSTAGIVHWVPGYVNSNNTQLIAGDSAAGTSGATMAASGAVISPGTVFLQANAKSCRCVAACVKVSYPGNEQGRSGRIHYGHTAAALLDGGVTVNPDNVSQTLQNYTRTPPEIIELTWKPAIADTEFNDPAEAASAALRDRKSAITVSWAGLPVNTGLTMHFTAVYEWTPTTGLGIGHNSSGKARSSNTLDDVVDAVLDTGYKFAGQVGTGMGVGATHAAATYIAQVFGRMPSVGAARRLGFR